MEHRSIEDLARNGTHTLVKTPQSGESGTRSLTRCRFLVPTSEAELARLGEVIADRGWEMPEEIQAGLGTKIYHGGSYWR